MKNKKYLVFALVCLTFLGALGYKYVSGIPKNKSYFVVTNNGTAIGVSYCKITGSKLYYKKDEEIVTIANTPFMCIIKDEDEV